MKTEKAGKCDVFWGTVILIISKWFKVTVCMPSRSIQPIYIVSLFY